MLAGLMIVIVNPNFATELQCEWEYRDKAYLGGWARGITRAQRFPTLEEAQKVCKNLGDNCGGITFWGGG